MKKFLFLLLSMCPFIAKAQSENEIAIPSPAQLVWQDAEITAVFHYDLHVFDGKVYDQNQNHITPIPDMNMFNPTHYDTDQWIRSVKGMGAKIAILTATHETGFALYQSDVNPYCLKAIKWKDGKGDIVRDFVNSCRKYGIKPGIYIGVRWNSFFGVYKFQTPNDGTEFQKNRQLFYNRMCEGMTRELMSRYGDLAIVWYDGGSMPSELGTMDVLPIVEKYQKNIIFYHNQQRSDIRWGLNEEGFANYPCWGAFPYWSMSPLKDGIPIHLDRNKLFKHGDSHGKYYMPAMSDVPLRGYKGHSWFWEPNQEKCVYPLKSLMKMYEQAVGRNSTLIFGVTPDPRGLVPQPDSIRMAEFGTALKEKYSNPLKCCSGKGKKYEIKLTKPSEVSYFVIQEDISKGERVLQYQIQGKVDGRWDLLAEGSCIGHKRIEVLKEKKKVSAVRLIIKDALIEPIIKNFSVYK